MNIRIAGFVCVALAATCWGQPAGQPAAPAPPVAPAGRGGFGGAAVKSPEVSADRRVTVRLRAPNAQAVTVNIAGQRVPLEKNEQGVWSATTPPLEPDVYEYSFLVDGAQFPDPGNGLLKLSFVGGGNTLVRVPGGNAWDLSSVPHGAISHHFFHSSVVGDDRDFYVYTPPDYDRNRKEPYPVLYLLHGLGDEASGWLATGSANLILDNLIAQGKAKPMIMVNPLGYGFPTTSRELRGMSGDSSSNFAKTLLEEVVPRVEKLYRASPDRGQRAIAGLSMGGAEAVYTGLNHPDRFAWVASFSGAFVMWPRSSQGAPATTPPAGGGRGGRGGPPMTADDFEISFPALNAKAVNSQLRMLWISCGTEDGLNGVNRQFKGWLKSKNVEVKDLEHPGAHTWSVWRHNLTDLAPLLFQPKGK